MKQAARSTGQPRQQRADRQQPEHTQRDSGPRVVKPPPPPVKSSNVYRPLPLGSEAFMAPIAPPPAQRTLLPRKVVLLGAIGFGCCAALAALVLSWMLRGSPAEVAKVGLAPRAPRPPAAAPESAAQRAMKAAAAELPAHAARALAMSERETPSPAETSPPENDSAKPAASAQPAQAETAAATKDTPKPEAKAEPDESSKPRASARKRSRSTEKPKQRLIAKPSRAQVLSAMARIQPQVKACFNGTHGVVTADITVLGRTGRVTTAQISGQPGPIGSCVARAVRRARFPKFSDESISIRYPMKF